MDTSDFFTISTRQPARMPPDLKDLSPLARGRSGKPLECTYSPLSSSPRSRRKSAGSCYMRTVKEERVDMERQRKSNQEGRTVSHSQTEKQGSSSSSSSSSNCPRGSSRHALSVPSLRERTARNSTSNDIPSGSSRRRSSANTSCGPLPTWDEYFEKCEDVKPRADSSDTFRVYFGGSSGPVLFLLHGAGHTALSWACFARILREDATPFRVIAYDARGHGMTECTDSKTLSAEVLTEDGLSLIQYLYDRISSEEMKRLDQAQETEVDLHTNTNLQNRTESDKSTHCLPSVILIGHSMGGAIATRMAASGRVPQLHGLMVLDVVEGTALAALPQMAAFVSRFPSLFTSCKEAVNWSIYSGLLINKKSACISIPSQLAKTRRSALPASHRRPDKGLPDEEVWTWRVDLMATEPYWEGWFRGMSQAFLSSRCVKILICSGSDRLDKELMIAHMQGKFQVQIISGSGHVIEEDQPEELCRIVKAFIARYRLHLPPSQRVDILRS